MVGSGSLASGTFTGSAAGSSASERASVDCASASVSDWEMPSPARSESGSALVPASGLRGLPNENGLATVVLCFALGVARPLLEGVPGFELGAEREASGEGFVAGADAVALEAADVRGVVVVDDFERGVDFADALGLVVCGLVDVLGLLTASGSAGLPAAAVRERGVPLLGPDAFLTPLMLLTALPVLPLRLRAISDGPAPAPSTGVVGFDLISVGLVLAEAVLKVEVDMVGLPVKTGDDRSLAGDFLVVDSTRGRALASEAVVGAAAVECLRVGVAPDLALSALVVEACEIAETDDSRLEAWVGDSGSSVEGKGTETGGGELHRGELGAESLPVSACGEEGQPSPSTWTPSSLSAEPGTTSGTTSTLGLVITGARTGL